MPARPVLCSECKDALPPAKGGPARKTCSDKCRSARSDRLKKARVKAGKNRAHPEHLQPLAKAARGEVDDAMHEVAKEEIRPLVREAITEDVLKAVQTLVGLTPKLVACIEADLDSLDDTVRQRAYTLLARYTLGNQSVAPAPADVQPAAMQVVFQLPRPGDISPELPVPAEDTDAVELRACVECSQDRPTTDFVAGSDRCSTCHAELQARVAERFGG